MNAITALKTLGYTTSDNPEQSDIKKRFRSLSLRHHPDKGGDPEEFKRINLAYRILTGEEKADETILPPPSKTDEMFTEVFRGFDDLFSKMNGKKSIRPKKKRICLSVSELFTGAMREFEFRKGETCETCNGTGTGSKTICTLCKGGGYLTISRRNTTSPSFQKIKCTKCNGRGAVGKGSNKMCAPCAGEGIIYTVTNKIIRIPKGVKHNARIIVGENTHTPIELIIQYPNQTDPDWIGWSINDDTRGIEYTHKITLKDALLGATHMIKHPNGTEFEIKIKSGVQSGDIMKFKDKGLPACPELKMPPTNANVKIEIRIPKLNKKDKKLAEEFFSKLTQPDAS